MSSGDKFPQFFVYPGLSLFHVFWKTVLLNTWFWVESFWFEHFKCASLLSSWVHCFYKNSVVNLIEVPLEVMSQLSLAFRIFFLSFSFSTFFCLFVSVFVFTLIFVGFSMWKLRFPKSFEVFQSYFFFFFLCLLVFSLQVYWWT